MRLEACVNKVVCWWRSVSLEVCFPQDPPQEVQVVFEYIEVSYKRYTSNI